MILSTVTVVVWPEDAILFVRANSVIVMQGSQKMKTQKRNLHYQRATGYTIPLPLWDIGKIISALEKKACN